MNLAIINFTELAVPDIAYNYIFTSSKSSYEDKLADICLQLDELRYIKNDQIDLVLVYASPFSNLQLDKINETDEVIRFLGNSMKDSFYCRPGVLSMFANLYKLQDHHYNFNALSTQFNMVNEYEIFMVKLLYLAQRLGIPVYVK